MGSYFHVAALPLAAGSVVEPGNWGRVLQHNYADLLTPHREAVYEMIRLSCYPQKPSRLSCLFACPDELAATAYRNTHAVAGIIYEVELLDSDCATHRARIADVYAPPPNYRPLVKDLQAAAHHYWAGASANDTVPVEIVCMSAARIVRRCG